MNLEQIKSFLEKAQNVRFQLPNGELVPEHFHVTEIGLVTKHFIDCGGTERLEKAINFQLWDANDFDHRLMPEKLLKIISLAERQLGIENAEIEVEYQGNTIEKYSLSTDGSNLILEVKQTACLAQDQCGIPTEKQKIKIGEKKSINACSPAGGCC